MINIVDWYWIVGAPGSEVFSSAALAYVATDDAAYTAWRDAGNVPSGIDSAGSLFGVFQAQWMPRQFAVGVALTSGSNASLNGQYAIDDASLSTIQRLANAIAAGQGLPGGGSTFNYPDINGALHGFADTEFQSFASAVTNLIYNYQNTLHAILSGESATLPPLSISI